MLKNITTKVLYEKRRGILLWVIIIFVTNIAIAMLFPAIRDTMGTMIGSVPAGMEKWFGEASTWQTYTGYAGQELFGEMAIILIIVAILFGTSFLAGYENNGTLITLLSRQISRRQVYWQKYLALVVVLVVVAIAFFCGAIFGGLLLGETVEIGILSKCMLMVFLLSLSLGSVAYALGGITGKSGVAGIIVGVYAFVAYIIASLSTAADVVDKLSYGSLFKYASAPDVIANGLNIIDIIILISVTVISILVAKTVFEKRDLATH